MLANDFPKSDKVADPDDGMSRPVIPIIDYLNCLFYDFIFSSMPYSYGTVTWLLIVAILRALLSALLTRRPIKPTNAK